MHLTYFDKSGRKGICESSIRRDHFQGEIDIRGGVPNLSRGGGGEGPVRQSGQNTQNLFIKIQSIIWSVMCMVLNNVVWNGNHS